MTALVGAVLALVVVAAIGSNVDPNPNSPGLWVAVIIGAMIFGAAVVRAR